MDPLDFLAIADRLRSSTDEGELRTSIGRSYYALYNFLIESLVPHSVLFSRKSDDHGRLAYYLTNLSDRSAYKIGDILKSLRIERNSADYKMAGIVQPTKSEFVFKQAQEAIWIFKNMNVVAVATKIKNLAPYQPRKP